MVTNLTTEILNVAYTQQTFPALAILFVIMTLVFIFTGTIMVKALKVKKFSYVVLVSFIINIIFLVALYFLPNFVQSIVNVFSGGA